MERWITAYAHSGRESTGLCAEGGGQCHRNLELLSTYYVPGMVLSPFPAPFHLSLTKVLLQVPVPSPFSCTMKRLRLGGMKRLALGLPAQAGTPEFKSGPDSRGPALQHCVPLPSDSEVPLVTEK